MCYEKPSVEDITDISYLFRMSFPEEKLSNKFSERLIRAYLKYPEFSLIAKKDGKIIAFMYAIDNIAKLSKESKIIDKLTNKYNYFVPAKRKYFDKPFVLVGFVDKAYRGKNIASNLLKEVLKQFNNQSSVFCQVYLKNTPSANLIKKFDAKLIETGGFIKKYGIYELSTENAKSL
jgi:GNAT superfamily N-acetyltransferase